MALGDSLTFSVADACDRVIRRTDRAEARVVAATIRFGTGMAALSAATAPNVYVGFVDLITLATLHRLWLEEPWAFEMFAEEDRLLLHQTFAEKEKALWERAQAISTPQQQAELRESILAWRAANPDRRDLSSVRLIEFASSRHIGQSGQTAAAPASIFRLLMIDPAANLSPATREIAQSRLLAERLGFFGKRLPLVLSWQVELASSRLLNSSVAQGLLEEGSRVAESAADFSISVNRLATSYERTLDELPKERSAAIQQVDQAVAERGQALIEQASAALASERAAAIDQLGQAFSTTLETSMDRLGQQFDAQSKETFDRAAAIIAHERAQVSESLSALFAEVDTSSQRLVDRIALRAIVVIVVGALAVACIVFAYRRLDARFAGTSPRPQHHGPQHHYLERSRS
jgi:hypothetical protein